MIFPEPRKDRLHQKGLAFVSTLAFAILTFVFLSISDLEIKKSSREVFRRIDMTSLMPDQLRLGYLQNSESSRNSVQLIAQANAGGVANEKGEKSAGENVDINALNNNRVVRDEETSTRGGETLKASRNSASKPSEPSRTQGQSTPPVINKNVEESRPTTPATFDNGSTGNSGTVASNKNGLSKLPLDSFGRDYKNLDVREIINWMKKNPAELPKGIRQLVRFRPAFLSSIATFTMEGKQYELYLMCKESLFEVHVVLVEQNEATYLVDRSFQKLSTYLRKGQVRRTQDNQIIAVRSNMASNDSSDEFYSLFLSWWDWTSQNQAE